MMYDGAGLLAIPDSAADPHHDDGPDGSDAHAAHAAPDPTPPFVPLALGEAPAGERRELVIIDPGVQDWQTLLAAVPPGAEVAMLSANRDPLDQISDILAGYRDLGGLHVISHGDDGELLFSSGAVDRETLDARAADVAWWSRSLTEDADILVYGCDVGAGDQGQAFVERLAALTGADVAASIDATGAAALDGDWVQERTVGTIEIRTLRPEAYGGLLAGGSYPITMGGTSTDTGDCIAIDASGNVYVGGYYSGITDLDPSAGTTSFTSAGGTDGFVAKYDNTGTLVWAKSFGSTSTDEVRGITVDGSGNVFVTGRFTGTVDFDPGAGVTDLTSAGATDPFVVKLDGDGNLLWAKSFGSASASGESAYSPRIDSSGNVYLCGDYFDTVDFDPGAGTSNMTSAGSGDAYVLKLDSAGGFQWVAGFRGGPTGGSAILALDGSDNVWVNHWAFGTVDCDPAAGTTANLTSAGQTDEFLTKLTSSGTYLWSGRIGGTDYERLDGMACDGSGNVYVSGSFKLTADLDPSGGTNNAVSAGHYDVFIVKLDNSGAFQWAGNIGGTGADYANGIGFDTSGNVYVGGYYSTTVDFDPGADVNSVTSAGSSDIYLLKLDASGNFLWTTNAGGVSSDNANGMAVDSDGNAFVVGFFSSTDTDFDPGAGTALRSPAGSSDIFVWKLDSSGNLSTGPIAAEAPSPLPPPPPPEASREAPPPPPPPQSAPPPAEAIVGGVGESVLAGGAGADGLAPPAAAPAAPAAADVAAVTQDVARTIQLMTDAGLSRTEQVRVINTMGGDALVRGLQNSADSTGRQVGETLAKVAKGEGVSQNDLKRQLVEAGADRDTTMAYLLAFQKVQKDQRTEMFGGALAQVGSLPDPFARPVDLGPPPVFGQRVALMIGVENYGGGIPRLNTPHEDVAGLSEVLKGRFGYDTVTLRDAGHGDIVTALMRVGAALRPDQSLVVYYAGHGYVKEDTGVGYWLPRDARADRANEWISTRDIANFLGKIKAKQIIVISDSCYSGTLTREMAFGAEAAGKDPKQVQDLRSVMVMTSGGEEPVYDDGYPGHSPFAGNLIQTLGSMPADRVGFDVFSEVKGKVVQAVPQTPSYGAMLSAGHQVGGDYVFALK